MSQRENGRTEEGDDECVQGRASGLKEKKDKSPWKWLQVHTFTQPLPTQSCLEN